MLPLVLPPLRGCAGDDQDALTPMPTCSCIQSTMQSTPGKVWSSPKGYEERPLRSKAIGPKLDPGSTPHAQSAESLIKGYRLKPARNVSIDIFLGHPERDLRRTT